MLKKRGLICAYPADAGKADETWEPNLPFTDSPFSLRHSVPHISPNFRVVCYVVELNGRALPPYKKWKYFCISFPVKNRTYDHCVYSHTLVDRGRRGSWMSHDGLGQYTINKSGSNNHTGINSSLILYILWPLEKLNSAVILSRYSVDGNQTHRLVLRTTTVHSHHRLQYPLEPRWDK